MCCGPATVRTCCLRRHARGRLRSTQSPSAFKSKSSPPSSSKVLKGLLSTGWAEAQPSQMLPCSCACGSEGRGSGCACCNSLPALPSTLDGAAVVSVVAGALWTAWLTRWWACISSEILDRRWLADEKRTEYTQAGHWSDLCAGKALRAVRHAAYAIPGACAKRIPRAGVPPRCREDCERNKRNNHRPMTSEQVQALADARRVMLTWHGPSSKFLCTRAYERSGKKRVSVVGVEDQGQARAVCVPQQIDSRGGRHCARRERARWSNGTRLEWRGLELKRFTARPTKDDRSKWDSEECAMAKASQLSVARSDTAPTELMTCVCTRQRSVGGSIGLDARVKRTAKLRTCRCTLASCASCICARAIASRAASGPEVPERREGGACAFRGRRCAQRCAEHCRCSDRTRADESSRVCETKSNTCKRERGAGKVGFETGKRTEHQDAASRIGVCQLHLCRGERACQCGTIARVLGERRGGGPAHCGKAARRVVGALAACRNVGEVQGKGDARPGHRQRLGQGWHARHATNARQSNERHPQERGCVYGGGQVLHNVSRTDNIDEARHIVQKLLVHVQRDPVGKPGVLREPRVAGVVGRARLLVMPLATLFARLDASGQHLLDAATGTSNVPWLLGLGLGWSGFGRSTKRFAAQTVFKSLARGKIGLQRGQGFFHSAQ